jgi:broad specificity phosphatase PhoE
MSTPKDPVFYPPMDVFAVRHAQPLPEGNDPGIDPSRSDAIESTGSKIAQVLGSTFCVTICSSPRRRTIETGERLLQTGALKDHTHQSQPEIISLLGEAEYYLKNPHERSLDMNEQLDKMARFAIEAGERTQRKPGLVIITHKPILEEMSILQTQHKLNRTVPDYSYASVTPFRWSARK